MVVAVIAGVLVGLYILIRTYRPAVPKRASKLVNGQSPTGARLPPAKSPSIAPGDYLPGVVGESDH